MALAIVFAVIILLALLRFGAAVEYGGAGLTVTARAGPIRLRVYPGKAKTESAEERAAKKARKDKKAEKKAERKAKKKPKDKTPGSFRDYLEMLPAVKKTLGRLRRRFLVNNLTVHFIAAGPDPSKTAQLYGASNAAFGLVVPAFEKVFRVRRKDLRASVDFDASEPYIYIYAAVSLAVWEAIYIVLAVVPALLKTIKQPVVQVKIKPDEGKDVKEDGTAPDK